MTLRVGQIPYLNSEPFYHGLEAPEIELVPVPPRAMGELAQGGGLDAGLFSLVQGFGLLDRFEPLGEIGISVKGEVKSVLLLARAPVEELAGGVIGVTEESATAVQLLKVLLQQRYHVEPAVYASLKASHLDALLLIGDQALTARLPRSEFPYRYDLAAEWSHWTGLPFVFARWMAGRSLPAPQKAALEARLGERLEENLAHHLEAIAAKRASLGLTPSEVVSYLRAFRYRLGQEDHRAMETFRRAWLALPAVKETTP